MKPGQIIFKGKTKKGNDIVIRYPLKTDVKVLRNYVNALSKEKTFITFQGEQLSLEYERKYLNDFIKKMTENKAIKLLVFCQRKLAAVANIKLKDRIFGHVGGFGITVAKDFRNEGIGKLLMKLIFNEAKKNIKGLRLVTLSVFISNPIARRMYGKMGFKEYAKLPRGIKYKNKFIDEILMYKNI